MRDTRTPVVAISLSGSKRSFSFTAGRAKGNRINRSKLLHGDELQGRARSSQRQRTPQCCSSHARPAWLSSTQAAGQLQHLFTRQERFFLQPPSSGLPPFPTALPSQPAGANCCHPCAGGGATGHTERATTPRKKSINLMAYLVISTSRTDFISLPR